MGCHKAIKCFVMKKEPKNGLGPFGQAQSLWDLNEIAWFCSKDISPSGAAQSLKPVPLQ